MSDYTKRLNAASDYASRYDANKIGGVLSWNDRYLAGLYRNGLMLTQHKAYLLMDDERYGASGKPIMAPIPTEDEEDLWPQETWVIYRE